MSSHEHKSATGAFGTNIAQRREHQDRRRYSLRTVTYCGLQGRGRRRDARRSGEDYYLDWYDPKLVFTGIAVLFMSWLDALFTLTLLGRGAYEANYFMARLLESSEVLFVNVKLSVTALGIVILLMHSHFRIMRLAKGKRLLQILLLLYGLLIVYEMILLAVLRA
jgi:hypothetical protein